MSCVSIPDYRDHALKTMDKNSSDFFAEASGRETTLKNNERAFLRIRINPSILNDVSQRNMSTNVMGQIIDVPFGVSPTAFHKMAHPEGESATAKAVGSHNTVYIMSMIATSTMEEIAKDAPGTIKWFQTFIYKDRNFTLDLIRRSENAGFKAIVATVDAPMLGIRYAHKRNNFALPPHLRFALFDNKNTEKILESEGNAGISRYVQDLFDTSLTWEAVSWLKANTKLPLVLKGVLSPEDALKAIQYGADAILVSNHGARQLDGVPATIEALPSIVRAVNGKIDVYLDGGIRDGTDIFKALALGAKMVFVGRPIIWGLAHDGQRGVENILDILKTELDSTMAISGCASLNDITKDKVVHESEYSKL